MISNEFGPVAPIPADVKEIYLKFAYNSLATGYKDMFTKRVTKPSEDWSNGKSYAILSKTDGNIYLFDAEHNLVAKKSVLIGSEHSDAGFDTNNYKAQKSNGNYTVNPPDRTPSGLYEVGTKTFKTPIGNVSESIGGKFMPLFSLDGKVKYGAQDKA